MSRSRAEGLRSAIATVREDRRWRALALVAAVALGLAVALVHWVGFLLAGVLIAAVAASLREALAVAALAGGIASLAFLGHLARHGQMDVAMETGVILVAALALPVVLTLLGAAVRGLW